MKINLPSHLPTSVNTSAITLPNNSGADSPANNTPSMQKPALGNTDLKKMRVHSPLEYRVATTATKNPMDRWKTAEFVKSSKLETAAVLNPKIRREQNGLPPFQFEIPVESVQMKSVHNTSAPNSVNHSRVASLDIRDHQTAEVPAPEHVMSKLNEALALHDETQFQDVQLRQSTVSLFQAVENDYSLSQANKSQSSTNHGSTISDRVELPYQAYAESVKDVFFETDMSADHEDHIDSQDEQTRIIQTHDGIKNIVPLEVPKESKAVSEDTNSVNAATPAPVESTGDSVTPDPIPSRSTTSHDARSISQTSSELATRGSFRSRVQNTARFIGVLTRSASQKIKPKAAPEVQHSLNREMTQSSLSSSSNAESNSKSSYRLPEISPTHGEDLTGLFAGK